MLCAEKRAVSKVWVALLAVLAVGCAKKEDDKNAHNLSGEFTVTVVNESATAVTASPAVGGDVFWWCRSTNENDTYTIASHSSQAITITIKCQYNTGGEVARAIADSKICVDLPTVWAFWSRKLRYIVDLDQTKYEVALPKPLKLAWIDGAKTQLQEAEIADPGESVMIAGAKRIATDGSDAGVYSSAEDGNTIYIESKNDEALYLEVPLSILPAGTSFHPKTAALISSDLGVPGPKDVVFMRSSEAIQLPDRSGCSFAGGTVTCADTLKGCVGDDI